MLKCFTKRREGNIITLWKVAAEITPSFQNQYTISPCSRSILCEDSEYSILGPPSSICPRLSWRRLKAGSRCRLGQQVRLNKVPKKYLLHTARNQPVLRPADKISKHLSTAITVSISTNIYTDIYKPQTHLTFKKLL